MKNSIRNIIGTALLLCLLTNYGASAGNVKIDSVAEATESRTVLFITGALVTNDGWDAWKTYFEQKGYRVYAPAWPYKDGDAEELRSRQPDRGLASLRLDSLVNYFAAYAETLPEKPILIGHSTGGLVAQLLLQRGIGAAAIAYHSVPPMGVVTLKYSFVKSVTPVLGLFTSKNKPFVISFKQWQYAFTNGMSLQDQKEAYAKYMTPESKRLSRSALGKSAKINFKKAHAPLLFVSGAEDNLMPASLNKKNFKKYTDKTSITEYKEFAGRNHFAMGQATWKEDADYMMKWIEGIEKNRPAQLVSGK